MDPQTFLLLLYSILIKYGDIECGGEVSRQEEGGEKCLRWVHDTRYISYVTRHMRMRSGSEQDSGWVVWVWGGAYM